MKARRAYLLDSAEDTRAIYAQLSDNGESVATRYMPSVEELDEARVPEAFERALIENAERERLLAVSLVGPHRDEWVLFLGGQPAKQYASQGQARSLAVALKLAGFRYLERVRGDTPILLFDEVFGELDPGRGKRLLDLVGGFAQALITSVQPATADQLGGGAASFTIAAGNVEGRS
jgi:DNA replication and repair protein RecF